ncbi:hypothetical protein [Occultella kanbiaonis]|uniref:hypothetical protein n=1 Tax=Occultella kanbiaonis TaxID=2675754 RepID=UPI0013D7278F|nr:hypothetical protein [Occultella kanbiaonis]
MTKTRVVLIVGEDRLAHEVRPLSTLASLDYVDQVSMRTSVVASAQEWARAMFGDEPDLAERVIWHGLLRLRLSRSHDTVAGWRIAAAEWDRIRLEAHSALVAGNLIVNIGDGRVALTTCIRYLHPVGRVVWGVLAPIHRRLAPSLVRTAEAAVQRSRPAH